MYWIVKLLELNIVKLTSEGIVYWVGRKNLVHVASTLTKNPAKNEKARRKTKEK